MAAITIERSIIIKATQEAIWSNIVLFERQALWSPWLIIEPSCKRTLTGEDGKVWTIDRWEWKIIGSWERENTKIITGEFLDQSLHFEKPWKSTARTFMVLQKQGKDEFQVTWGIQTQLPFYLFFMKNTLTTMISKDYDRGLKMLKTLSETEKLQTSIEEVGTGEEPQVYWIGRAHTCSVSEVSQMMIWDFEALWKFAGEKWFKVNAFRSYYPKVDMKTETFTFQSVFVIEKDIWEGFDTLPDDIIKWSYKAVQTFTLRHHGSYKFLDNTWIWVFMYLRAKKRKQNKKVPPYETYINDPMNTPVHELITDVSVPIK